MRTFLLLIAVSAVVNDAAQPKTSPPLPQPPSAQHQATNGQEHGKQKERQNANHSNGVAGENQQQKSEHGATGAQVANKQQSHANGAPAPIQQLGALGAFWTWFVKTLAGVGLATWVAIFAAIVALAGVYVATLYFFATVGILLAMVKSNKHTETAYKDGKADTETSLQLTRDGQTDTRRAIKIAEDQLRSVLSVVRARVILDIARTEDDGQPKSKISSSASRPSLPSKVTVYFLNAGYSPAVNVAISAGFYFGEDRISDTLGDRGEMSEDDKMTTIGPGKPAHVFIALPEQSVTKVTQVLAGVEELAVAGEVVYREIFPDTPEHTLTYRAIYEPRRGVWLNVESQTD